METDFCSRQKTPALLDTFFMILVECLFLNIIENHELSPVVINPHIDSSEKCNKNYDIVLNVLSELIDTFGAINQSKIISIKQQMPMQL
jgi:hypothetical protein